MKRACWSQHCPRTRGRRLGFGISVQCLEKKPRSRAIESPCALSQTSDLGPSPCSHTNTRLQSSDLEKCHPPGSREKTRREDRSALSRCRGADYKQQLERCPEATRGLCRVFQCGSALRPGTKGGRNVLVRRDPSPARRAACPRRLLRLSHVTPRVAACASASITPMVPSLPVPACVPRVVF